MTRFSMPFTIEGRLETVGADVESARELAELYEQCILLKEPLPKQVIGEIGTRGRYLCYDDMLSVVGNRQVTEGSSVRPIRPGHIDRVATKHWISYIAALRPDLHNLITELNTKEKIFGVPGEWYSRSLVYRTIISKEGLEELWLDPESRKKFGAQTMKSLDALTDIAPSMVGR